MPQRVGNFIIIDIESGDYEIGNDDLSAEEVVRARHAQGIFFRMRIGHASAYSLLGFRRPPPILIPTPKSSV